MHHVAAYEMTGLRWLLVAALAGPGIACAHGGAPRNAGTAPDDDEATARRMYAAGEQQLAEGHPEKAVELWRGAIETLPQTEAYDDVRHALVLRLGYGQMLAYERTGQLAYLFGAKRMLDLYVVRHEELFGDDEVARVARGQVFEVLHQVESLIETPPPEQLEADAVSAVGHIEGIERAVVDRSTRRSSPRTRRGSPQDDDEGLHRTIVVKHRRTADIDDVVLRAALVDWNPDPDAHSVLTRPGVEQWVPARAYVRLDGVPRQTASAASPIVARGLAIEIVRTLRSHLRECYESAYARVPADYAAVRIALSVAGTGTITEPEIVRGGLGDPTADTCALGRLEGAQLDRADSSTLARGESTRVEFDLLFFYDETIFMSEAHGRAPGLDPPPEDPAAEPHG